MVERIRGVGSQVRVGCPMQVQPERMWAEGKGKTLQTFQNFVSNEAEVIDNTGGIWKIFLCLSFL